MKNPPQGFAQAPSARKAAQASPPGPHAQPPRIAQAVRRIPWVFALLCVALASTGCAVVAVADAAVTVAATAVKVGASVVGATVDVGAAGVRAVTGSSKED